MWVRKRRLLIVSLSALSMACASSSVPTAPSKPDAVYVALAERLLRWAGATQGTFEARPFLVGFDSSEVSRDLAYVARETPNLDSGMLASIRQNARDTSCLPLPTQWGAYNLKLKTVCGSSEPQHRLANRARKYRSVVLGATAISFSADSSEALVLGGIYCGSLCALVAYYLFESTDQGWRVARTFVIAES